MYYKIAPLVINPEKNTGTISDVYISTPSNDQESMAGRFFALIEISSHTPDNLKVISFLINDLEENYYHSEKLVIKDRPRVIKVEHIFEAAIAKTNKNLVDFIANEKIKFNPYELNVIIGIIHENFLHFATIGKNKAFLIYKNKIQGAEAKIKAKIPVNEVKYKLTNIIDETSGPEAVQLNPAKLFSSVISGAIPNNGYFIFTNEALSEYLSDKQLVDIVTTLPPLSAVEQIKNTLSRVNAYVSFLGIILKNTFGLSEEDETYEQEPKSTDESIRSLNVMEEKTEKYLSPGGYFSAKKWIKKGFSFLGGAVSTAVSSGREKMPQAEDIKEKVLSKRRSVFALIGRLFSAFKTIGLFLFASLITLLRIMTDKDKLVSFFSAVYKGTIAFFTGIRDFFTGIVRWIANLSARNKAIISIAFACLLLFAGNIVYKTFESKKGSETIALASIAKSIEQKQNQVEATLLYGDETAVRKLLAEIKDLLDKLPKPKDNVYDPYQAYYAKNDVQLEKIRHVEQMDDMVELTDFSKLEAGADPTDMIVVAGGNDRIYASDGAKKTIYKLDVADKAASAIPVAEELAGLSYPNQDKSGNIYYLDNGQIIMLDAKTGKTAASKINVSEKQENVIGAKMFNGRIYLLSKADGQIYRHTKVGAGYSGGEKWLDEASDFSNASSMDIDGTVYVAKADGTVMKFLKGAREQFDIDPVEPAINSAVKMTIGTDAKYFYLLEPAQKRLAVFDADGKFLMQYTSKKFTGLKDFAINEKQKAIYFLDGSIVYRSEMRHMK